MLSRHQIKARALAAHLTGTVAQAHERAPGLTQANRIGPPVFTGLAQ
jgi:hypothetical protein